jgi:acetyl-CoA carboxylase biotin carboxyl carrier protein
MVDVSKLEQILSLMQQYGVEYVQVEQGSERYCLSKSVPTQVSQGQNSAPQNSNLLSSTTAPQTISSTSNIVQGLSADANTPHTKLESPKGEIIKSPVVGTFYRSPSPEAQVFVNEGSRVKKGQVLCIVEAMKLMNEIESELDGTIVQVLVENGKPVEFGTPLFLIAP